ncbi:RNA-splicing factor [Desmophyllum pertusum]|uniref:RNA-splicing factor n=1 Tax=Desmophyllum pertusum TaxID=174260 RepID=A0A9W9Z157_9CNID|nr:RNA-splicing factor [Desmophyllum pertusum]
MGGGDLNLKKSWHPQTLRNVERVWKAEQKAEAETKKIDQLRKELEEERARENMQRHAVEQGIAKKKGERLDWMYAAAAAGQVDREMYLLGKPVDKVVDPMAQNDEEESTAPGASFINDASANTVNDLAAKVRDDPLFLIKKKEEEKRKELLNNPVKMKQLKQMLQANLEKSKKKKRKDKKKKSKREKKERQRGKRDAQREVTSQKTTQE